MDKIRMTLEDCRALCIAVLEANDCDGANAAAIAATVTAAERDHAHSHGLFRMPGYVTGLRSGRVNGRAAPHAERQGPTVIRVHGDRGYMPIAHTTGLPLLAEAAREQGMAALAIVRTHHFAALWPETEALAAQGLVAYAFTSSIPHVAPFGGTKPFFGTNPMAFAWPRRGRPPMAFDQAAAATARGEVLIAAREGRRVAEGVGIDAAGRPTTDPADILKGAQLPFGGHKGSAIALMIDLLAGPLIGEAASCEAGEQDNGDGTAAAGGELILALDPATFGAQDPVGHAERLFARMTDQPGVRLPGERRLAARARAPSDGIEVPSALWERILDLQPR